MRDVLHSLLLFPQAYSKLQEGKCFLWPTAELHFALQALRPSLPASSATALFLQVLVSNLDPLPATRKFVPGLQSLQGVLRYQAYLQAGYDHFQI